jgi:hypothetical protein
MEPFFYMTINFINASYPIGRSKASDDKSNDTCNTSAVSGFVGFCGGT